MEQCENYSLEVGIVAQKVKEYESKLAAPCDYKILPLELIKIWQRSRTPFKEREDYSKIETGIDNSEAKAFDKLEGLIGFLKQEVENAKRISFVAEGFEPSLPLKQGKRENNPPKIHTASALFVGKTNLPCLFCDRDNHLSQNCFEAAKMLESDRLKRVRDAKVCFKWLRRNHLKKDCRSFVRCKGCQGPHFQIMCRGTSHSQENLNWRSDNRSHNSLAEQNEGKNVPLDNVDEGKAFKMEALEETIICGDISPVETGPRQWELNKKGITLTKVDNNKTEIDILIGGDSYGQLLTGNTEQLARGLTAIQIVLGWTLIGNTSSEKPETRAQMGQFDPYEEVFQSWFRENLIEEVDGEDIKPIGHYLPHRPIYKVPSETTPIRPVYDASCKAKNRTLADIHKAFQTIGIYEKERDYLRFLWWDEQDPSKIRTLRHTRVVFGLTCSRFILAAVLKYHLESIVDYRKLVADVLKRSLYVDNLVFSVDEPDDLERIREVANDIMDEAKMTLRQWEYGGFYAPIFLIPELLIQRAWLLKLGWDQPLPMVIQQEFKKWSEELDHVKKLEFPRCAKVTCSENLHVFGDSRKRAYATVAFLRSVLDGVFHVSLLAAKTRVTALKSMTIPRLELLACLLSARLTTSIVRALARPIKTIF
ncbi:hypothetical protein LAZ67_2005470 [Cordylochernes scorpioides]|uniref:Peptidase aspartic putative domain-containing protein n=1 Tax=Cordylochernes scorpioides TaxID=51811 RepID=A0ABY6K4K6_9ARAC|nr:hypothetical protein LAZ67_2005470 [Cordylochernes scorpioides]